MISCVDIVEMNGCIFSFAEKNPANAENAAQNRTESTRAINTLKSIGRESKFHGPIPMNETIFVPGCRIRPVVTEPSATIRPTERSVPARRIRPATPSA